MRGHQWADELSACLIVVVPTNIFRWIFSYSLINIDAIMCEDTEFPNIYKIAQVTPIYKKGDALRPENYRPISSLPILSKVFETIVNKQLVDYLESYDLLSDRQFGFRKEVSTEQMLLAVTDKFLAGLDTRQPRFIAHLSLDVRKAFDSVDHTLLLRKMRRKFNFAHRTVEFFSSYLLNRWQVMKVGSALSAPMRITKGVPQGSVLGPILFNIMINDALEIDVNTFAYADDTLIYEIANSAQEAIGAVERRYEVLLKWYLSNGPALVPVKAMCMVYSN